LAISISGGLRDRARIQLYSSISGVFRFLSWGRGDIILSISPAFKARVMTLKILYYIQPMGGEGN